MPIQPRTPDQIYTDIKSRLTSTIAKLTNFVSGSFNDEWLTAYSEQVHEAEVKALASELAGYVDYAGKDLTEDDLDELGVDNIDPERINKYMHDSQLDRLAQNVSVTRDSGTKATGQASIQTSSDTIAIPEGFNVSTTPDPQTNESLTFYVDADGDGIIDQDSTATVTPADGTTEVTVDIVAGDVGEEYNVGAGAIDYIPTPKPGVESVNNPTETS